MTVGRTKRRQKAAKILSFMPRTIVEPPGSRSPGEGFVTWGPNYDWPPIVASSWQPILSGKILGTCTLAIFHWQAGIANCLVIRWGCGLRVLLPEQKWTDHFGKDHYAQIFAFVSDQAQRDFEEAALRAVRALIAKITDWPASETLKASLKHLREQAQHKRNWHAAREKHGYSMAGWQAARQRVLERDGFACRDCGDKSAILQCTHIIPATQGGDDSDDNLIIRCRRCASRAQKDSRAAKAQPIIPRPNVTEDCPF